MAAKWRTCRKTWWAPAKTDRSSTSSRRVRWWKARNPEGQPVRGVRDGLHVVRAAAGRRALDGRQPDVGTGRLLLQPRGVGGEGIAERAFSGVHVGEEPDGLRQPGCEQRTPRRGGVPLRRGDRASGVRACDPTGARPTGVFEVHIEELVADHTGVWSEEADSETDHWLAADIPAWDELSNTEKGLATYQWRYLTNDGRLFFNSFDSLVAQDTNGKADVYEYEPSGIGSARRRVRRSANARGVRVVDLLGNFQRRIGVPRCGREGPGRRRSRRRVP